MVIVSPQSRGGHPDLAALGDLPDELLDSLESGELSLLPARAISALAKALRTGYLMVPKLGRRALATCSTACGGGTAGPPTSRS